MKLPVRKCFHAAKVGFFVILVVTILALFEQWRGGKRSARAQSSDLEDAYEREILEDEARIIPGLGEGGVAAHLTGEAKRLGEESEKKLAINVYLSDRIAYNRTLKDQRNPACQRVVYDAELPSASVILIFHNEPYSVVVRTVWSVINSARRSQPWYRKANYVDRETGRTMTLGYPGQDPASPFVYLKEIILVDDNSTLPELKGKLSHYVRTRLPPDLIRILRLPDRQGLILARIAGARLARGAVLVFLDAHCEPGADWLRPLLQRAALKRDAVVTPLIDVVDQTTFRLDAAQQFQVGGFTFMGHFTWIDVPEREKKRRGSDIAPTWSPTMAGGLFAISRAYYWEIGAYDEQMAGWGGENLEMSFRVWQCGGTLETIPCSRVGHVFRSFHPYGLPAQSDTHGINTARMAEVWMDEYAELFYLHRPDLRKSPKIGDVTHRRVLREKLKCKSFQWYLDNVYPEKFVPVRDVYGFGRFMNPASGLCLDTLQREGEASPLGVYGCHSRLEATQYLALSLRGELRDEEKCAEVQYKRSRAGEVGEDVSRRVLMVTCHGKQRGQKWRYLPTQQLQHAESGLCLSVTAAAGSDATVAKCRATPRQLWKIDYSEMNDFGLNNAIEPSEQELRLQKLRGNRRISRSLLSYPEEERNKTRRHHHKSKKSKKHKHKSKKNKFILKLIRTVNNTEEHLEADVYCRHKQLFPNNSFVRDLVTVLNDKDIKVINNGRVFEHNRVSELARPEPAAAARQPLEPKPQKKRKQKKTNHLIEPLNFLSNANTIDRIDRIDKSNAIDAIDRTEVTEEPVQKKIIIEDFVEVKPGTVTTQRSGKRHKRVRPREPARPTLAPPRHHAAAAGGNEWEDPVRAAKGSSLEDAPLLSEERRAPDTSDETWPAVESRFRRNNTRAYAMVRTRTRAPRDYSAVPVFTQPQDPDNSVSDHRSGDEAPAPVKVVMRSNLTFNLGDEFFRWRQHTADDVANLLGELVIPANTDRHKQTSADTDDTHTQTHTLSHTRHRDDAPPHKHHTDNTQSQTHYADDRTQPDTENTKTHKHHTDNTQFTDDRTELDTENTITHKTDRDADVDENEIEYRQESDKENELHRQSEREFRNTEQSRKEFSNREERDKDDLLTGRGRSRIVPDESSSSESGDD